MAGEITYSKGHLDVFSSPDVHSSIVSSNFGEILTIDREQAASYCRCPGILILERYSMNYLKLSH